MSYYDNQTTDDDRERNEEMTPGWFKVGRKVFKYILISLSVLVYGISFIQIIRHNDPKFLEEMHFSDKTTALAQADADAFEVLRFSPSVQSNTDGSFAFYRYFYNPDSGELDVSFRYNTNKITGGQTDGAFKVKLYSCTQDSSDRTIYSVHYPTREITGSKTKYGYTHLLFEDINIDYYQNAYYKYYHEPNETYTVEYAKDAGLIWMIRIEHEGAVVFEDAIFHNNTSFTYPDYK